MRYAFLVLFQVLACLWLCAQSNFITTEIRQSIGVNLQDELRLSDENVSINGSVHQKYIQYHQGVRVFGSAIHQHLSSHKPTKVNGYFIRDLAMEQPPQIAENWVAQKISVLSLYDKIEFNFSQSYKIESDEMIIIDRFFPSSNSRKEPTWAVQIEVANQNNSKRQSIILDYPSGKLIYDYPMVVNHDHPGKGKSLYYGEVDFRCDSIENNKFILRDYSRGEGVITNNGNGITYENPNSYWDLSLQNDEAAIDLHFCTSRFFDMMKNQFNWEGVDGKGGSLIGHLSDRFYVNASWNGRHATFGRGDCNHGPLTTLEVVGHEFMHGVTDYTSDLIYRDESGAINESISDIFGKALEYYVIPNQLDWSVGKSFIIGPYGDYFRSMSNPHLKSNPKEYKGRFWVNGGNVHNNSSVGNYWFYLLVNGGRDTTESGVQFDVKPIEIEKAFQIVFLLQRSYLFPSAGYEHFYRYSLEAAESLYPGDINIQESLKEAWKAVGIPQKSIPRLQDLAISIHLDKDQVCLDSQVLGFTYIITNRGEEVYNGILNPVQLRVENASLGSFNQILQPGESVTIRDSQSLIIQFYGFDWIWLSMISHDDDFLGNNRDYQILYNANPERYDLELDVDQYFEAYCDLENVVFEVNLINYSCETVVKDYPVQLICENLTTKEEKIIDIKVSELMFDEREEIIIQLDKDFVGNSMLNFKLSHQFEIQDRINSVFVTPRIPKNIDSVFIDPMDELRDEYYRAQGNYNFGIKEYQNENYFLATNNRFTGHPHPCESPSSTLDNFGVGRLEFCMDGSDLSDPTLHFDVVLFRNEATVVLQELKDQLAMVRVKWIFRGRNFEEVIYDIPEGVRKTFNYPLPDKFIGKIIFDFYTHTGISDIDHPDVLKYDVVLLDNVRISNGTTNQANIQFDEVYRLSPNPGVSEVKVSGDGGISQVIILNQTGQTKKVPFQNNGIQMVISTESLKPGVYFFQIIGKSGRTQILKWVKI